MRQILYAVFDSPEIAAAAQRAMETLHGEPVVVRVHEGGAVPAEEIRGAGIEVHRFDGGDLRTDDLPIKQTNVRHAVARGALIGAIGGTLFGVLFSLIGLVRATALPTALFGMIGGAIAGVLGAFLTGASDPERGLDRISHQIEGRPQVVLTIETPDLATQERAERILTGLGGHLSHKATV